MKTRAKTVDFDRIRDNPHLMELHHIRPLHYHTLSDSTVLPTATAGVQV